MRNQQQWTGEFWVKSTLTDIGLVVNFGHELDSCASPSAIRAMHVIDANGIFSVKVRFCGCDVTNGRITEPFIQLLRARKLLRRLRTFLPRSPSPTKQKTKHHKRTSKRHKQDLPPFQAIAPIIIIAVVDSRRVEACDGRVC